MTITLAQTQWYLKTALIERFFYVNICIFVLSVVIGRKILTEREKGQFSSVFFMVNGFISFLHKIAVKQSSFHFKINAFALFSILL